MRSVVILGGGGHAKVIIGAARAAGFSVRAVYDDAPERHGSMVLGVRVEGPTSEAPREGLPTIIAVGDNRARKQIAELPCEWISLVHPNAWVHDSVRMGAGTVVFAGAVIQPDAQLGEHVIVNTSASVDHDCVVGNFVHLAPGTTLGGDATVGEGTLLGIGANVIRGVSIGRWSVIGAGATCVAPVGDDVVAVGLPAKASRRSS
jgi:sugar O-acyltransferase (sialic acid O-acetyltransferase NeuD family)